MVTEQARWVLVNTKVDPLLVAEVWGITENECWDYLTEVNRNLNEMEEKYRTQEQRSLAQEWANSLPEAYETKRQLLLERLQNATSEEEKKERLINYKLFTNKIKSLPAEQIARAKNYPLMDLLNTNKKITNCPFHDDRTASLNIKNNFFHCHGCGVSGDTITFVMKRDGLSFKEAVIKLT